MTSSFTEALTPKGVPLAIKTAAYGVLARDVGTRFIFGSTAPAAATWTLPAPASIYPGFAIRVKQSSRFVLSLDPGAGVSIDGLAAGVPLAVVQGQEGLIAFDGAGWTTFEFQKRVRLPGVGPLAANSVAGAAQTLLLPLGFTSFDLKIHAQHSLGGAVSPTLNMRAAFDAAGTSFSSAATYARGGQVQTGSGATQFSTFAATGETTSIMLTNVAGVANIWADAQMTFHPGLAGQFGISNPEWLVNWMCWGASGYIGRHHFAGYFGRDVAPTTTSPATGLQFYWDNASAAFLAGTYITLEGIV